jgi:hypothetical protein
VELLLDRPGVTVEQNPRIHERRRRDDKTVRLQVAEPGLVVGDGGVFGHVRADQGSHTMRKNRAFADGRPESVVWN